MIRVGIVGALGYGGREFMRLIMAHPEAELVAAVVREGGKKLAEALPAFGKMSDLTLESFDAKSLAERCDVVFLAVPGTRSMELGAALFDAGVRVMDLGSDFRIKDPVAYKQYYKADYSRAELAKEAVYGHVPWYRDAITTARVVAVPGCFPISILTPLRPLIDAAAPEVPVVINSISGVSGAGKGLSDVFHYPAMNENMKAYKLAVHQHIPEIEQELGGLHTVQFTPHVAPLTRGILSTIVLRPSKEIDPAALLACYDDEPFVRVMPEGQIPDINQVRGSNFCDIGFVRDGRTGNIIVVSCIDNLCGGTAGMGIQCMNVAFGINERAGLMLPGMAP
jgi:N-acetyl-gamma-glutamyl-phosphate reductase